MGLVRGRSWLPYKPECPTVTTLPYAVEAWTAAALCVIRCPGCPDDRSTSGGASPITHGRAGQIAMRRAGDEIHIAYQRLVGKP